jgi:hypothetical protein
MARTNILKINNLQARNQQTPFGPSLAEQWANSPQEAGMFIWVVILAMALIGGYWVKTRRQRKTKAATYAGN